MIIPPQWQRVLWTVKMLVPLSKTFFLAASWFFGRMQSTGLEKGELRACISYFPLNGFANTAIWKYFVWLPAYMTNNKFTLILIDLYMIIKTERNRRPFCSFPIRSLSALTGLLEKPACPAPSCCHSPSGSALPSLSGTVNTPTTLWPCFRRLVYTSCPNKLWPISASLSLFW